MIPKTLRRFINRLVDETDAGNVEWQVGAPASYYCAHKAYELHIHYTFDIDRELGGFSFRIKGPEGSEGFFTVTDEEADFRIIQNLYDTISVRAGGFDDLEEKFFN